MCGAKGIMKINREMLKSRIIWVTEISGLSLTLSHNAGNWTLYQVEGPAERIVHEVTNQQSTSAMFYTLKGMYELLWLMQQQKKVKKVNNKKEKNKK